MKILVWCPCSVNLKSLMCSTRTICSSLLITNGPNLPRCCTCVDALLIFFTYSLWSYTSTWSTLKTIKTTSKPILLSLSLPSSILVGMTLSSCTKLAGEITLVTLGTTQTWSIPMVQLQTCSFKTLQTLTTSQTSWWCQYWCCNNWSRHSSICAYLIRWATS